LGILVESRNAKFEEGRLLYLCAFAIGVIAGLRALTAPAAISWGAKLGWLHLEGAWLAFLGAAATAYILSAAAIGELINDKLPKTPSRKAPPSFAFRIVTGAVSGAALGVGGGSMAGGLIAGAAGAVAGTLGGAAARGALAKAFGRDFPAALLEDLVAVCGAFWIASRA
jgi:uncharacterized membrane protein